jgi:hypothetical protein
MDNNKIEIKDQPNVGKIAKAGALFLVLWSILHIWVGAEGIKQYITSGESGLWNLMTGGSNAPHNLFQHTTDSMTLNAHKHLLLNFCMDVGGYGILGLILSFMVYKKGSWMAYFIAIVAIGIADLTFLFSMVTPGIIELNLGSISGPIIWFIAMALIPFGLPKFNKNDLF